MKLIDKAILWMVSESLGRNVSEPTGGLVKANRIIRMDNVCGARPEWLTRQIAGIDHGLSRYKVGSSNPIIRRSCGRIGCGNDPSNPEQDQKQTNNESDPAAESEVVGNRIARNKDGKCAGQEGTPEVPAPRNLLPSVIHHRETEEAEH